MALMTSLVALAIDAMLPALAQIGTDLGAPHENAAQWVVTALLAGMALGQLVFGPLSDNIGRKPPVYVGLGLFALGCLVSLLATGFPVMLAGRFLQGLGVAAPRSVSIALIRDLHAGRDMARIMSWIMSVFILVPIVAPALGQTILAVAHWRAIFGVFLVLALVIFVWFEMRQPETLPAGERQPFDPRRTLARFGQVLLNRPAMGFTLTAGLASGPFIAYLSTAQQLFQGAYDTGNRFALWFALLAASIGSASLVNGRLVVRLGMVRLSTLALRILGTLSAAFGVYAWLDGGHPPFVSFFLYLFGAFFCMGILFGNMNSLAMEPLGEMAGVGASVVTSLSLFVSILVGGWIGQSYDGTVLPLVIGFTVASAVCLPLMAWSDRGRLTPPDTTDPSPARR